jgi:hypothetical protein
MTAGAVDARATLLRSSDVPLRKGGRSTLSRSPGRARECGQRYPE